MDSLHIGVSSWIIQDGNYPDFRIGDALNIALQFHPYRICESKSNSQQDRTHRSLGVVGGNHEVSQDSGYRHIQPNRECPFCDFSVSRNLMRDRE